MSNKQIIKRVFDEEFDSKKMKQQILLKYEGKVKKKMIRITKYAIIPICVIFMAFIVISLNNEKNISKKGYIGTMKVYAYTMSENKKLEKTELKDNVKLGLASYNLAMSSVPGYPIMFELDNIDYINISVTNGTILDWNRKTNNVKSIGNMHKLYENDILYFNVNINTNIKIIGIKDKKEVFEKNITISRDDDFNYYAMIK